MNENWTEATAWWLTVGGLTVLMRTGFPVCLLGIPAVVVGLRVIWKRR